MPLNNDTSFKYETTTSSDFDCKPTTGSEFIYFVIASGIQILLNTVIIAAAIRSRRKLRQNFVYAYVTSTLAANISFGLCTILMTSFNQMSSAHPHSIDYDKADDRAKMRWWSFRRSLTASVFLIMNANVGALIYGLRDSSYFIGRFVETSSTNESTSRISRGRKTVLMTSVSYSSFTTQFSVLRASIKSRKNKAIFLIVASWLLPLLLSLVPPLTEVCSVHCLCSPGNYVDIVCHSDIYTYCSRIWIPLSKYFLAVVVGTWVVETFCVVGLLLSTVAKFIRVVYPDSKGSQNTAEEGSSSESQRLAISCCRKPPPLNNSVKLVITITSSYVVFTVPTMTVLTMDIFSASDGLSFVAVVSCLLLTILYAFMSPVIMIKYMPGLRSALVDLLSLLDCSRSSERTNPINVTPTASRSTVLSGTT